jgi:hypothetical protein
MGYGLDCRGSIPGRGKTFFCIAYRPALGLNEPPIYWGLGVISPGVKRPGSEADHSLSCSAKVKNCGAIPPLPHVSSWHSVLLIK